jgi:hypothetical protein
MLIILRRDPQSGKQNIIVKLESDPDSLPIEHEQMHRKLVEKLVAAGQKLEDLGEIIVERETKAEPVSPTGTPNEPQKEKTAQSG